MNDERPRRQPQDVKVQIVGETEDVQYWTSELARIASSQGNYVRRNDAEGSLVIIPRSIDS